MSNYDKDLTHIRSLLDRYFRCKTSPEEEKELDDFFARSLSDLPADLEAGRRFFRALGSVPETIEVPAGLEASPKESLNEKAAGYATSENSPRFRLLHRPRLYRLVEVAATFALLFGLGAAVMMHTSDKPGDQPDSLIALAPSAVKPLPESSLLSYSPSPSVSSEASAQSTAVQLPSQTDAESQSKSTPKRTKKVASIKSDGQRSNIRIINDPKEAEAVLRNMGDHLDGVFLNLKNSLDNSSSALEKNLEKISNDLNKTTV